MKNSQGSIVSNKYQICFLTLCWVGKMSFASGTFGSLLALFLALPILFFSQNTLFLMAVLIGVIAVKQIDLYEAQGGKHDDKSIVIDELVGQWIALAFVSFSWVGIISAFVFFRIFDICKPSLIGYCDRKIKGGLGVVTDDVLAGILAGLCASGMLKGFQFFIQSV